MDYTRHMGAGGRADGQTHRLVVVMDNTIAYGFETLENWQPNMPDFSALLEMRPLPRRYKSNWRILHIDGFENSKPIQFFSFTKLGGL